jgi:hypothetical protein
VAHLHPSCSALRDAEVRISLICAGVLRGDRELGDQAARRLAAAGLSPGGLEARER